MGGRTLRVALACGRSAIRDSWRQALALALVGGLLGAVALGAVAGARRTATAYNRYLVSVNASDVFVNVPGTLPRVAAIAEVPPALVDESDQAEGSILPPGATRQLLPEYFYAWIGLRLARGTAGIPELQRHLATLAADLQRQE